MSKRTNSSKSPSAASPKQAKFSRSLQLTEEDLRALTSNAGLVRLLNKKGVPIDKAVETLRYRDELEKLQIELVRLQRSIQLEQRRVVIVFEGRDAAGKGGAIRRFIEHLNPRTARVVALPKPTDREKGQWYFRRYIAKLPNPGEICFFDRSWYNRAVVEPVMDFCTEAQYAQFMQQVPDFERMMFDDGIEMIKFWCSISKTEQAERFDSRRSDPLKQWKISPVDEQAQERWDLYTRYKDEMFKRSHTDFSPWIIVQADDKKKARLESIRYVLGHLDYKRKDEAGTSLVADPAIVSRYNPDE